MIRDTLYAAIKKIAPADVRFTLERPERSEFGDYSTNVALASAALLKKFPRDIAEDIAEALRAQKIPGVAAIEVAGGGFINMYLENGVFAANLADIIAAREAYGRNKRHAGEKILIEYTDPNPFKEFHIGHLMSNAIGEALSRLLEASGADVKRANYQGDVGLHVARALWAMERRKISFAGLRLWGRATERMRFLGEAYAYGSKQYEENPEAKAAIERINEEIYEKKNPGDRLHGDYRIGRRWSLEYFDEMYERLGTAFDYYFFESETGERGRKIVGEGLASGIFERSEGAVVFRGEHHGLHTRVFLTSAGLPTYEAKELGLAQRKQEAYPYTRSISVTGNEVTDYFRVVLAAAEQLWGKEFVGKIQHVPHGMLRLPEGKMSSRTGDVITVDALIADVKDAIRERVHAMTADAVAIGAIKYSVLRQAIGQDIIFDFEKSLSFEGDSGPYLQYTHARAHSVVERAHARGIHESIEKPEHAGDMERILFAFPEVVERALRELAPQLIATYLIELARAFNHYYAEERIADAGEKAPYRVALAAATEIVLKNGLWLLGIRAPERM